MLPGRQLGLAIILTSAMFEIRMCLFDLAVEYSQDAMVCHPKNDRGIANDNQRYHVLDCGEYAINGRSFAFEAIQAGRNNFSISVATGAEDAGFWPVTSFLSTTTWEAQSSPFS